MTKSWQTYYAPCVALSKGLMATTPNSVASTALKELLSMSEYIMSGGGFETLRMDYELYVREFGFYSQMGFGFFDLILIFTLFFKLLASLKLNTT